MEENETVLTLLLASFTPFSHDSINDRVVLAQDSISEKDLLAWTRIQGALQKTVLIFTE